jgi:cardiolipin synthase
MLLAIPVAWLLVRGEYEITLWVFAFAAVTDALDGFLAKRFNWESELGKALDPLADKILLVTAFIALTIVSHVPLWLAVAVVARDVIIAFGAIFFQFVFGPVNGHPTAISKLNTLLQIVYVIVVVGAQAAESTAKTTVIVLTTLVLVTTVASGVDYVATYIQRAMDISRRRAQRDNSR